MWPIAALGLFGFAFAIAFGIIFLRPGHSRYSLRAVAAIPAVFGVASMATGVLGYWVGMQAARGAVANVESDLRETLMRQAHEEAMCNIYFGTGVCVVLFFATIFLWMIGMSRSSKVDRA